MAIATGSMAAESFDKNVLVAMNCEHEIAKTKELLRKKKNVSRFFFVPALIFSTDAASGKKHDILICNNVIHWIPVRCMWGMRLLFAPHRGRCFPFLLRLHCTLASYNIFPFPSLSVRFTLFFLLHSSFFPPSSGDKLFLILEMCFVLLRFPFRCSWLLDTICVDFATFSGHWMCFHILNFSCEFCCIFFCRLTKTNAFGCAVCNEISISVTKFEA